MYVPNYIPDPIEIPGNVSEELYASRLTFIRSVQILHFGSFLVIGLVSCIPWKPPFQATLLGFGIILGSLVVVRVAFRKARTEAVFSTSLLLPLLVSLGFLVQHFQARGYPIWAVVFGPGFALIYALLCGRDHSFVGQFMLSLIASSTAIAALSVAAPTTLLDARFALIANAIYLGYFVYDLASLLARRRSHEKLAAVVDLYRDVLNIFGYLVRCVRHWRKHRIFVIPR
jgi:hypothetical protein